MRPASPGAEALASREAGGAGASTRAPRNAGLPPARVKREGDALGPPPVLVEGRVTAMDRTEFFGLGMRCDLRGGTAVWQHGLSSRPVAIVHHRMDPEPRMEAAFPLRDPQNPLMRVHPRYAGPDGGLSDNVTRGKVQLENHFAPLIMRLAQDDLDDGRAARLPLWTAPQWKKVLTDLKDDFAAQLDRLIDGNMPTQPRYEVGRLRAQDLPPHEQMLAGQHGLFVRDCAEVERPLLSRGKVLGLYLGALMETDRELLAYRQQHPQSDEYEMAARREVTISAQGAANGTAFANTALLPDTDTPQYDHSRLNAMFLPFRVQLTDKDGQTHSQPVIALVALDNVYGPGNPRREVRTNYGEGYLQQFQNVWAQARTPGRTASPEVKPEPESPVASTAPDTPILGGRGTAGEPAGRAGMLPLRRSSRLVLSAHGIPASSRGEAVTSLSASHGARPAKTSGGPTRRRAVADLGVGAPAPLAGRRQPSDEMEDVIHVGLPHPRITAPPPGAPGARSALPPPDDALDAMVVDEPVRSMSPAPAPVHLARQPTFGADPLARPRQTAPASRAPVAASNALALGVNRAAVKSRLAQRDLHVIENDGRSGEDRINNCLIISLLQHATGDYTTPHAEAANNVRRTLTEVHPDIGTDDTLYADGLAAETLISHVLQNPVPGTSTGGAAHDRTVLFLQPVSDGTLVPWYVGDQHRDADHVVAIIDWGGHFEAVRNDSGHGWPQLIDALNREARAASGTASTGAGPAMDPLQPREDAHGMNASARPRRRPPPQLEEHQNALNDLPKTGLQPYDAGIYASFLSHLETGPGVGGKTIRTLTAFNDLPIEDQIGLVNAAQNDGLNAGTRWAINRAQQREGDRLLLPPGGLLRARTGPRSKRTALARTEHKQEMLRVGRMKELPSRARSQYASFLAHLETRPSVGGQVIRTVAAFNALSMSEQNALVTAAMPSRLHAGARQAINLAQQRQGERCLVPPGGASRARTEPRPRRPLPEHPAHLVERQRVYGMKGLRRGDAPFYSAFLAHLETGPRVDGETVHTLAAFNALSLAHQNMLVDAAIAGPLKSGTRMAINRAQGRTGDRQLTRPASVYKPHPGDDGTARDV